MKKNKKPENHVATYRPTVRYHSIYRTYVDSLFQATELDRNQIMRCALLQQRTTLFFSANESV
ncbi:hypothetical protein F6Y02_07940 (plasmid) [Bacillus megaterium]|nr:hypothetical protein [Priestia megaterium]